MRVSRKAYDKLMRLGRKEEFWMDVAKERVHWFTEPTKALSVRDDIFADWFPDGTTNMSYNCLDRHLNTRGSQTAIAYESPVGGRSREITYASLLEDVKSFAGSLQDIGVEKGDRVILYVVFSCTITPTLKNQHTNTGTCQWFRKLLWRCLHVHVLVQYIA